MYGTKNIIKKQSRKKVQNMEVVDRKKVQVKSENVCNDEEGREVTKKGDVRGKKSG